MATKQDTESKSGKEKNQGKASCITNAISHSTNVTIYIHVLYLVNRLKSYLQHLSPV